MKVDAKEVETVILALGKGVALAFPVTAPIVGIISAAISALDAAGIIPEHTDAVNIDAVRAQMSGTAARASSAVTHAKEHK